SCREKPTKLRSSSMTRSPSVRYYQILTFSENRLLVPAFSSTADGQRGTPRRPSADGVTRLPSPLPYVFHLQGIAPKLLTHSPVPGAEVHMFFDTRPHAAGRPGPVGVFGAFRAGGAAVPRATRTSAPDGEHSFSRRRGRDANRLEELVRPGLAVRRIPQQVRQRQRTQPLAVRVRADSPRPGAGGAAEELCARDERARAGGH